MLVPLLFLAILGDVLSQCPRKERIYPCTCKNSKTGDDPSILCEGLSSVSLLVKPIKSLQGKKIAEFDLEKSNIGQLPADLFRGVQIKSLTIAFTNLTSLGELNKPPFLGLEQSLEELEIRESFLNEKNPLSRLSLSHLKKLRLLIIESNLLPVIGNDWFESGPYGLKELFLMDAYTETLGSRVFSSLTNLLKLTLTGTKITSITRSMLPDFAPRLEALDLSDNQLTFLPSDIFFAMPSLREVYLDNNAIKSIDETVWAPVWGQLEHVHLSGNSLVCDKDIGWMYTYRLPEVLTGDCAEPEALRARNLTSLTSEDFN